MSVKGIVNGVCVDPEKYFMSLVEGKDPADYAKVIISIREKLWQYGIGYQGRSDGTPSSRLFLPLNVCQDARPLTAEEKHLGVKQVEACWALTADTVKNDADGNPSEWQWVVGGEGTYLPVGVASAPTPAPHAGILSKEEALVFLGKLDGLYRNLLKRQEGIGGDMQAIAQWFFSGVIEGKSIEQVEKDLRNSDEYRMKNS